MSKNSKTLIDLVQKAKSPKRTSVGDTMEITPRKPTEDSLWDDNALTGTIHLNRLARAVKKKKTIDTRVGIQIMDQCEKQGTSF